VLILDKLWQVLFAAQQNFDLQDNAAGERGEEGGEGGLEGGLSGLRMAENLFS